MSESLKTQQKSTSNHLLILACSATKRTDIAEAPALDIYNGPNFKVLRKYLNEKGWPPGFAIKIISAEYGIIDATKIIKPYNLRLNKERAREKNPQVLKELKELRHSKSVFINLGKDYLPAIDGIEDIFTPERVTYAPGRIGEKMRDMKRWLHALPNRTASVPRRQSEERSYLYFFPDWDDYVYEPFHENETSEMRKSGSVQKTYTHEILGDQTPYDGLLISLAQLQNGKGALARLSKQEPKSFKLREELRLPEELLMFGDCGAFSYSSEEEPPFLPEKAAELYEKFGFDLGASVDHIPLPYIMIKDKDGNRIKKTLSDSERQERIKLTTSNADVFFRTCQDKDYHFKPIGVIQGITKADYIQSVRDYIDIGYKHIALGGLVPRRNQEILEICAAVREAIQQRTRGEQENVWVHLFGILRPEIQHSFQNLGISSFDSASFLRKAWLSSDKNYLDPSGKAWYGTIRVPISTSKAMQEAAENNHISNDKILEMESTCLSNLEKFDGTEASRKEILDSIDAYGPLLQRKGEDNHFVEKHEALLIDRPWEKCRCPFCKTAEINIVIFRGSNRNKRRGLHNTWVFYHKLLHKRKN